MTRLQEWLVPRARTWIEYKYMYKYKCEHEYTHKHKCKCKCKYQYDESMKYENGLCPELKVRSSVLEGAPAHM